MKQHIYLIRHGQTDWNVSNQHTGRTNLALNETGKKEAKRLKPFFQKILLDHVFVSPLKRCLETCCLAGLEEKMQKEPDLMEWDYGKYEGKTAVEIQQIKPQWNIFVDGADGGESTDDVFARAERILSALSSKKGNIALFSHGHFSRVLGALWIELPVKKAQYFAFFNAHICQLSWEKNARVISQWNIAP